MDIGRRPWQGLGCLAPLRAASMTQFDLANASCSAHNRIEPSPCHSQRAIAGRPHGQVNRSSWPISHRGAGLRHFVLNAKRSCTS